MNTSFPISIETYLKEAGFSQTEMLILRKLLEEDALTIRELGAKMGKSVGLVDQAVKKLMSKGIVRREHINDQPRYLINSLDAVVQWVKDDRKKHKEMLDRRHENFETFIATLKIDQKCPDLEHFSGLEGIQQAYDKLLAVGGEILTFTPVLYLAEDDPLRAYRVDLFRRRQIRKIFQRVLAVDSPLARRFQSRDLFEYRRTLLVPESELALAFEKTIVGDTVAYIDLKGENACFLKYPELAKSERAAFECLWVRTLEHEHDGTGTVSAGAVSTVIPLGTRIFSHLREFVLSKRSLWTILFFALLSGVFTIGLYDNNRSLNLERIKDKVMSIAATGALQFDAETVNAIWKPSDIDKPQYAKLIFTLNLIRRSNTDIQYAYIMRKTSDPKKLAFVADADSLYPDEKKDLNGDGIIDTADALNTPGELYDSDLFDRMDDAFTHAIASVGTDQWGTFISGYAPIRDKYGATVGILGIDMFASNLEKMTLTSLTPVYFFFALFLLFMLFRFWAGNRSLMEECFEVIKRNLRLTILWIVFLITLTYGIFFAFQQYKYHLWVEATGERLKAIAATAANQFDPEDFEQLHWARDMKTEAYQRVHDKLNEIRNNNPSVKYAYIVRMTATPHMYEFIADADSNYNLPNLWIDFNSDEILDDADENVWPGFNYFDANGDLFEKAKIQPVYGFSRDQWGYFITGVAGIYDENKQLVGFLGLDVVLGN